LLSKLQINHQGLTYQLPIIDMH